VQFEVNAKHSKDMFQVLMRPGKQVKYYVEFGGIQTQILVSLSEVKGLPD